MITPDDNGYARVKRWREKNRGLANMRQRAYRARKRVSGGEGSSELIAERHDEVDRDKSPSTPRKTKIEELRELIGRQHEYAEEVAVKPRIFRDDYGRVITEKQWERLQEIKRGAKEGGYEIDEWSQ